jgi:hypothetical protein
MPTQGVKKIFSLVVIQLISTQAFKVFQFSETNAVWASYEIQTMQNSYSILSVNYVTAASSSTT